MYKLSHITVLTRQSLYI